MNKIKIELPKNVEIIIKDIEKAGGEAYVVGGCVRDSLRGKEPNDWDITTNLVPEKVKTIFNEFKIVDKGIEFGTIAVYIDGEEYEITTFRKDAGSKDCRHPESVTFSETIDEDLARRDFTVNALAYNPQIGLVDCFNGYEDLKNGIIRAVGNPDERFKEDALRTLRAIRLSAQHGFKIEEATYEAIKHNAHLIENISEERFNKELVKTITSDRPEYVEYFYQSGIADVIFPELSEIFKCIQDNPNHFRGNRPTTVGEHTMDVLKAAVKCGHIDEVFNDLAVRLALLVHDFGKPSTKSRREKKGYGEIDSFFGHPDVSATIAEKCLRRLKFPKQLIADVCKLAKYHDIEFATSKNGRVLPNGAQLRKAYADFGGTKKNTIGLADTLMEKLFAVRICDVSGQNPDVVDNFNMMSSFEKILQIEIVKNKIKEDKNILNVVLPINGETVRESVGMTQKGMKVHGKFIGDVLKKMQEKVIKDNSFLAKLEKDLAKETIVDYAKSMGMNKIVPEEFFIN